MERDPLRLVWRAAPGLTIALVLVALVAGLPLLLLALESVRGAVAAVAHAGEDPVFMRLVLSLPERISETPFVILPGFGVPRRSLPLAVAIGLLVIAVSITLLWWIVSFLALRVGRRAHATVMSRVTEGIASASGSAQEQARHAASVAVELLRFDRRRLGLLPVMPVLVVAILVACFIWIGVRDIGSVVVLAVILGALAFASRRATAARRDFVQADRVLGKSLAGNLTGLARHLSAVARHGAHGPEGERILRDAAPIVSRTAGLEESALANAAVRVFLMVAAPLAVLAASLWAAHDQATSAGDVASSAVAAGVSVVCILAQRSSAGFQARTAALLSELGGILGGLQSRRANRTAYLPTGGRLEVSGVATALAAEGRLAGATFAFDLPGRIAFTGPPGGGARAAASLLGDQVRATRGTVTLGGDDFLSAPPDWRARHFAFAGSSTYLFPGTLRANLVYGAEDGPDLPDRLASALEIAGLVGMVDRRGLTGTIDPRQERGLADTLLSARRRLRALLEEQNLTRLVEPFDPARFNAHATIGENLLFGVPVGDTFRDDHLPTQPLMRSLLESEGLSKPLAEIGAQIAANTLEIFSDLPDDRSIVAGYSPVSMAEREELERLLDRRGAPQRGSAGSRDAERLISLAMGYVEPRARLGLITPEIEDRVVRARTRFAADLPKSLEPALELLDGERICAAASIRDNLLFGRIVTSLAEAERIVMRAIRAVLEESGLEHDIGRVGLLSRVDPLDHRMFDGELAAIEVVRCLLRDPDNLVVEHALDHLSHADAVAMTDRLVSACHGRGLLLALPETVADATRDRFDTVIRFDAGRVRSPEAPGDPAGAKTREDELRTHE